MMSLVPTWDVSIRGLDMSLTLGVRALVLVGAQVWHLAGDRTAYLRTPSTCCTDLGTLPSFSEPWGLLLLLPFLCKGEPSASMNKRSPWEREHAAPPSSLSESTLEKFVLAGHDGARL